MSQVIAEHTIDVRKLQPRDKHPTIFNAWNSIVGAGSILLLNDHDPLPLYYQFACENPGQFHWDYLEQGPELWRVRIQKGKFPDPGFVPAKGKSGRTPAAHACSVPEPLILDTRPIFERGATPCDEIDQAVASLQPNQKLVMLVPFEPVPLYAKLSPRRI